MSGRAGLRRFAVPAPAAPREREPVPAGTVPAGPVPAGPVPAASGPAASAAGEAAEAERCGLCAAQVPGEHGHIADLQDASLLCACRACWLLFTQPGVARGRYAAVPDRYLHDPDCPLTPAEADQLQVPVGLAFFLRTSRDGALGGFYPSPAGATECQLDLGAWDRLAAAHPLLRLAADDVEAVLLSRSGGRVECFVVPVDVCYELAGRIRLSWRGFDGGAEARGHIAAFLDRVREQARPAGGGHG